MVSSTITIEEFLKSAHDFVYISNKIKDGWKLVENEDVHQSYLIKNTFIQNRDKNHTTLLKTEFVIFYNMSYGVPCFSFNIWNSLGVLLTLESIRKMAFIDIDEKSFYFVITQQEHPLFHRPYFIVHPCHTETLLNAFRSKTKNIIVTFLGLISPLIKIDLSLEYGL